MRLLVVNICVLLSLTAAMSAQTAEVEYYAIMMDAQKIGYVIQTRTVDNNIVTTTEDMKMTLGRGGTAVSIGTVETSIETVEGKGIGFESIQDLGLMKSKTTGRITPDGKVEVTITAGTAAQNSVIDYPNGAIMAEGMRLLQIAKGLKQGTTYNALVFSPSLMASVNAKVTVGPRATIDLFGRVVNLTQVDVSMTMPAGAVNTTSFVDDKFRALKTLIPVMGMNLEMLACDKEFALSPNSLVDFLDKMLVQSPVVLADIKSRKSATYTLSPVNNGKLTIPSADSQSVRTPGDGKVVVEVRPFAAQAGVEFPYKGNDPKLLEALKPTQYLQCDNEDVVKLAKDAVGDCKDAAQAAQRIESFVAGYITEKDLSVGYASAAEVAASRQGDCTEHAVLTAAMCRAVGIPAQVVFGVVYVDDFIGRKNVFGGHAWTQVNIGGKWVCIDATRAPNGYSPGHIILGTGNGEPADFFGMVNTLGYFKIEKTVLE